LKTVRAGARLEGAAAEDIGARLLDMTGDFIKHRRALDGARARDHGHRAAADLDLADRDNRVLLVEFPLASLNGFMIGKHLLHAGNGLERFGLQFVLVADDTDNGPMLALAEVRLQAEFLDPVNDMVNFGSGAIGPEHE